MAPKLVKPVENARDVVCSFCVFLSLLTNSDA